MASGQVEFPISHGVLDGRAKSRISTKSFFHCVTSLGALLAGIGAAYAQNVTVTVTGSNGPLGGEGPCNAVYVPSQCPRGGEVTQPSRPSIELRAGSACAG